VCVRWYALGGGRAQEQDSCNDHAAPDQAQRKERCATGRGELYSAALDRPVAGAGGFRLQKRHYGSSRPWRSLKEIKRALKAGEIT